jgi:predicted dinucleotide-binding enzyme
MRHAVLGAGGVGGLVGGTLARTGHPVTFGYGAWCKGQRELSGKRATV